MRALLQTHSHYIYFNFKKYILFAIKMSECKINASDCNHHNCKISNSSLHQTLDEMEFERGIWYAAQTGDIQRVTKMLNEGRDANIVDGAGYTALHYAARNGHLTICKLLLSYRANINATTRSGGATALQRACSAGHVDVVKFLIQNKADCAMKDNDGKTALHRAAESQNREICTAIVNACPQLKKEVDVKGNFPVDYAKPEELAKYLC